MKKTYISPLTKITVVSIQHQLLTGSITGTKVYGTSASSSNAVLGREDNSWDIWGSNEDEDFED